MMQNLLSGQLITALVRIFVDSHLTRPGVYLRLEDIARSGPG